MTFTEILSYRSSPMWIDLQYQHIRIHTQICIVNPPKAILWNFHLLSVSALLQLYMNTLCTVLLLHNHDSHSTIHLITTYIHLSWSQSQNSHSKAALEYTAKARGSSHCSMTTVVEGLHLYVTQRQSFPHRIHFLWPCASGKTWKQLSLFQGGYIGNDLETCPVAPVILAMLCSGRLGLDWFAAVKCCLWLVLKVDSVMRGDELVKGSARPHTTATYQLVCMAGQPRSLLYTSHEGLCGRKECIFLLLQKLYQLRHKS